MRSSYTGSSLDSNHHTSRWRSLLFNIHMDIPLLVALLTLAGFGLIILYSAAGQNPDLIIRQLVRLSVAFGVLFVMAQIPPHYLRLWAPWLFATGVAMLIAVLWIGEIGKGAQRWLDLGFFRFQPSELLKIAVPMMIAWYLADKALPPTRLRLVVIAALILVPVGLIAKQPDLGTALLVATAGIFVIFLAGLSWRLILALVIAGAGLAPLLWSYMHAYQKQRVLTFLNPESDPLGSGYHIIQSKIAIGSGGLYGKGWLNGTQSHLEFLPERSTDFIFAVFGEEFGLLGILLLLTLYSIILIRGVIIAKMAQDTFCRLFAGSLTLTFFVYVVVNTGMVTGLLPVVGIPLPLISYGGTSMVTLMAAFGILMSIHTHRRLLAP